MSHLHLEDLKELDEDGVKAHIAENYGRDGYTHDQAVALQLEEYDVVIAYESVGSWGCDSSSFFLLRHKLSGELFEVRGSHCSCYGFEGQFEPEAVTVEHLKSDKFYLPCGGYDENDTANTKAVKDFIATL